ncbi:MAG: hypothetical protein R3E89_16410 [Thiolinea sp.]
MADHGTHSGQIPVPETGNSCSPAQVATGVANRSIIRRHIIPNLLGTVIVYVTLIVPQVILITESLSASGLCAAEPQTSPAY